MRAIILGLASWFQAQFAKWTGCLSVLGVIAIVGYLVWGVVFGLQWFGFVPSATVEPTAVPTVEATEVVPTATIAATSTQIPTATATVKVAAAKPAKKPAAAAKQPVAQQQVQQAVVQATAIPPTAVPAAPTVLRGDEGPCKGGTNNVHFVETREGIGNSGWLEYDITLQKGEVGLAWGSNIPGFGEGRSFVTIAGPWAGKIGIFNGAYRQGQVLTDLSQTQSFWGDIIDCDLQRSLPIDQQKRGLYQKFKVNW